MKKGILFDLDGTLWDSSEAVVKSWNQVLENIPGNKYHMTTEIMQGFMGKPMDVIAYGFFTEETKENALHLLNQCTDYENEYIRAHGGVLFENVRETLIQLKKEYFLAVVSNCQEGYIEAFMEYHKLSDLFDDTENYGRTLLQKEDNIQLVVERNHLEQAVYVGDTMGDYNATRKAGLPFIHAAYGFGSVPEDTMKINAIGELREAVRQIWK